MGASDIFASRLVAAASTLSWRPTNGISIVVTLDLSCPFDLSLSLRLSAPDDLEGSSIGLRSSGLVEEDEVCPNSAQK